MNRLPRHASRVRSPLRGRSATVPPLGRTSAYANAGVTPRSPVRRSTSAPGRTLVRGPSVVKSRPPAKPPAPTQPPLWQESYDPVREEDVQPVLLKLYNRWPSLFKVLDQPWKWLVALVLLIVLSIGIGSLL